MDAVKFLTYVDILQELNQTEEQEDNNKPIASKEALKAIQKRFKR